MDKHGLFTTVVGSWPLSNNKENMTKILTDMVNLNMDYPCYPQLVSMIDQFLYPLSEETDILTRKNGKYYLNQDFEIPNEPYALEYGNFMIDFFKENPTLKRNIKGMKACLTGPFTLTSELILKGELVKGIKPSVFREPRGIMIDWIVDKFAEIMKRVGKAYNDMGIEIVSMDEPLLGLLVGRKIFFHSKDFIIETINKSISGIKKLSSIHVCGRISPLLRDLLLQTNTRIIDNEFRTNELNFLIYKKKHFSRSDKYLGLGVVQTNIAETRGAELSHYVETVPSLKNYIKKGIKKFGKENIIIKPDCGFGALGKAFGSEKFAYDIALRKVTNMVTALNEIKNELKII